MSTEKWFSLLVGSEWMLFRARALIFFCIHCYIGDRNIYFLHSGLTGFCDFHVTCIQS